MEKFIKQCIINRKNLEFSFKDMSNCLINVSEEEYKEFEKGNYEMSKENLNRLIRVLCLVKPKKIILDDYIDTEGLSDKEKDDLSQIICDIVGDVGA